MTALDTEDTRDFIKENLHVLDDALLKDIEILIIQTRLKKIQVDFEKKNGCPLCRCAYDQILKTNGGRARI